MPLATRPATTSASPSLSRSAAVTRCRRSSLRSVAPSAWGRRPLQKPVAAVVDDIRRRRARSAIFVDLNLIASRRYALELFRGLAPLGIKWYGLATVRVADDPELLDAIEASGCRGLLLGLESIVSANLEGVRKGFNRPEEYGEVVARLHARRIAVQGFQEDFRGS